MENEGESSPRVPPVVRGGITSGRCHWCGYDLRGLAARGCCPECGKEYTPESAMRLTPPPSALMICLRLSWPLLGLVVFALPVAAGGSNAPAACGAYAMLVAIPINSYYQVRSMLKKHLPEQKRTQGFILGLRALGTTVAVLVLLITLLPLIVLGACLFTGNVGF